MINRVYAENMPAVTMAYYLKAGYNPVTVDDALWLERKIPLRQVLVSHIKRWLS